MSAIEVLIAGGLFYAFLVALTLLLATLAVLKLRLRPAEVRPIEGLPPELEAVLSPTVARLEALGFARVGQFEVRGALDLAESSSQPVIALSRADDEVLAVITPHASPEPGETEQVLLYAFFTDGSILAADSTGGGIFGAFAPPGIEVLGRSGALESFVAELSAARARAVAAGRTPAPIGDVAERGREVGARLVEHLVSLGVAGPTPAGELAPTLTGAAKITLRLRAIHRASPRRPSPAGPTGPTVPIAAELFAFAAAERLARSPWARISRRGILLVTFALFLASFSTLLDPAILITVTAVVLFHELGHLLAMRALGYHDTSIFFVPFLGGAATGKKSSVSLFEELIVLAAGPLPGLVVGVALLLTMGTTLASSELALRAVQLLLVVNAVNLLPIFPLDGGKIVDLLLFGRRPWLQAAFRMLAAAGFIAVGLGLGDGISLALGSFVALGIPTSVRIAKVLEALRRRPRGELPPAAEVFGVLPELGLGALPIANRHAIVRQVMPALRRLEPGLVTRVGLLSAHGVLTAVGVVASALSLVLPALAPSSIVKDQTISPCDFSLPSPGLDERGLAVVFETRAAASRHPPPGIGTWRRADRTWFGLVPASHEGEARAHMVGPDRHLVGEHRAIALRCEAKSPADAATVARELAVHSLGDPVEPAWRGRTREDPSARRTRETLAAYAMARGEAEPAMGALDTIADWWSIQQGDLRQASARWAERSAARAARLAERLEGARKDADLDPVLLDRLAASPDRVDSASVAASLRLSDPRLEVHGDVPNVTGRRVEVGFLGFADLGLGLPPLLADLCGRCERIDFGLAPAAEPDEDLAE